jgi:hypothetical protein
MEPLPPPRRERVYFGGARLAAILLAFGLLLAAVGWRGTHGAVAFLLLGVSAALALAPRLRRRENWFYYLLFAAVAGFLLWVSRS